MYGESARKNNALHGIQLPRHRYVILILVVLIASNLQGTQSSQAQSIILDVPYHDQQTSYYCGPASVMMVLDYTAKLDDSQYELSQELSTDKELGITYTSLMDEPFIQRDLTDVHDERLTLRQLKNQINQGYAPILLIWFDDTHETGHYVVAVGYNDTGVFINDPWPTQWDKPEGRETGCHVFLSYEKLLDLWSIRHNWAMTVAHIPSESDLYKVNIEIAGLPEKLKTRLSLNGETVDVLELGETTSLILLDAPHVVSVETVLYDIDGTDYYCTNNLQQVSESSTVYFSYTLLDR